jgi:hypothetical protein
VLAPARGSDPALSDDVAIGTSEDVRMRTVAVGELMADVKLPPDAPFSSSF